MTLTVIHNEPSINLVQLPSRRKLGSRWSQLLLGCPAGSPPGRGGVQRCSVVIRCLATATLPVRLSGRHRSYRLRRLAHAERHRAAPSSSTTLKNTAKMVWIYFHLVTNGTTDRPLKKAVTLSYGDLNPPLPIGPLSSWNGHIGPTGPGASQVVSGRGSPLGPFWPVSLARSLEWANVHLEKQAS